MAKKTTDKRPSRQKQKSRTLDNKKKQLKAHIERFPKDQNAKDKLEHVQKSGNPRGRNGINATIEQRKLNELRNNRFNNKKKKQR